MPALMAAIQVDLTAKPDASCRYQTRVPTLGRSLALRATGAVGHFWRTVCSRRRGKCHSLAPACSQYPVSRTVLPLEKTVTAVSSNSTRQPWSHRGPMPIKLLWNCGMMWAAVVGREERRRFNDAEERWGVAHAVPTRTWCALGLTFAQGAFGVR